MLKNFIRKAIDRAGVTMYRNHVLPVGTDYRKTLRRLEGTESFKTVFDVGANVGQFCIACNEILDRSKIYSFEPVESTFQILQSNTAGISNIECSPIGFGDQPQTINMYLHDLSTINSVSSQANVPRTEGQKTQLVKIVRLDDFCKDRGIEQIDLLKIDVEGFDLNVLQGATRMLSERKVRYIFIEVTFDTADAHHVSYQEIADFLAPYNFKIHGFYNQNLFLGSPVMNYCDALFHLQPAIEK